MHPAQTLPLQGSRKTVSNSSTMPCQTLIWVPPNQKSPFCFIPWTYRAVTDPEDTYLSKKNYCVLTMGRYIISRTAQTPIQQASASIICKAWPKPKIQGSVSTASTLACWVSRCSLRNFAIACTAMLWNYSWIQRQGWCIDIVKRSCFDSGSSLKYLSILENIIFGNDDFDIMPSIPHSSTQRSHDIGHASNLYQELCTSDSIGLLGRLQGLQYYCQVYVGQLTACLAELLRTRATHVGSQLWPLNAAAESRSAVIKMGSLRLHEALAKRLQLVYRVLGGITFAIGAISTATWTTSRGAKWNGTARDINMVVHSAVRIIKSPTISWVGQDEIHDPSILRNLQWIWILVACLEITQRDSKLFLA